MTDLKNNIVDVNSLLLTYCHTPNKKITSTQDTSECHRITSSLKGSIDFDYDSEVEVRSCKERGDELETRRFRSSFVNVKINLVADRGAARNCSV